jgi:hypothetical protein
MTKSELKLLIRETVEEISKMENPCWKGYKAYGTKNKGGKEVPNCVPVEEASTKCSVCGKELDGQLEECWEESYQSTNWDKVPEGDEHTCEGDEFYECYGDMEYTGVVEEAEYKGRKVKLGVPMQGDVKKSKVYVKNPKGNVVKVNFGDKKMRIKKSNPKRRKSFRARHNCANPGPRHKARYWSCRAW